MAGRYSPPPHPHPERSSSFNPLAHLLSHLADTPPSTPSVFSKVDLVNSSTHDPEDILREIRTDGDHPLPIDRNVLKSVVAKRMRARVTNITFLSSGTFHKAFLVGLEDQREVVCRIARRYMPKLKTESEVATINYIRQHTDVPVPIIYHFDSNPYNRLGGEYIIMSKAPGIPLHRAYHQFGPETLQAFLTSLARILTTLFAHRFPMIGSLYQTPANASPLPPAPGYKFRVGPIVSWPFFGGGRGERTDIPRGPWSSEREYLQACAEREIQTVRREGEGRLNPHRPHLPPPDEPSSSEDENDSLPSVTRVNSVMAIKSINPLPHGHSSFASPPPTAGHASGFHSAAGSGPVPGTPMRRLTRPNTRRQHSHRGAGLTSLVNSTVHSLAPSRNHSPEPEEASSSSDEDTYRDYRANLRSSLLVAHQMTRVQKCRADMDRFTQHMTETLGVDEKDEDFREFALDLHDLSSSNVFVDPYDHGKITCIIDWESTTIRPLWQCAHLPAFLTSDAHAVEANLFRQIMTDLASSPSITSPSTSTFGAQGVYSHQHGPKRPCSDSESKGSQDSTKRPVTRTSHTQSSPDVHPPGPITSQCLRTEAQRWLRAESEREPWRRAHKVVEWDGWEEGLVGMILDEELQHLHPHEIDNRVASGPIASTEPGGPNVDGLGVIGVNHGAGVGNGRFFAVGADIPARSGVVTGIDDTKPTRNTVGLNIVGLGLDTNNIKPPPLARGVGKFGFVGVVPS